MNGILYVHPENTGFTRSEISVNHTFVNVEWVSAWLAVIRVNMMIMMRRRSKMMRLRMSSSSSSSSPSSSLSSLSIRSLNCLHLLLHHHHNHLSPSSRLALPIANCAIGETVSHLAKGKQNSSPIWRNAFTIMLTRIFV